MLVQYLTAIVVLARLASSQTPCTPSSFNCVGNTGNQFVTCPLSGSYLANDILRCPGELICCQSTGDCEYVTSCAIGAVAQSPNAEPTAEEAAASPALYATPVAVMASSTPPIVVVVTPTPSVATPEAGNGLYSPPPSVPTSDVQTIRVPGGAVTYENLVSGGGNTYPQPVTTVPIDWNQPSQVYGGGAAQSSNQYNYNTWNPVPTVAYNPPQPVNYGYPKKKWYHHHRHTVKTHRTYHHHPHNPYIHHESATETATA
ncbi:hypothetical protein BC830DRAFT_1114289 [Chytriomyces sp. MP71]|nr:hypothetical protein BC830DRAFT_1132628 [Chytriomyces sp. MP71]KAI8617254.1 hypothetical protein BC830DRAFT_1114289 [Chytriomyces sp. MP71]